jgi:hypothetical protein
MAIYSIAYLYQSRDIPLVFGGGSKIEINAYNDASVGTGMNGRSVIGQLAKLHSQAGAIYAKSTATQGVHLSSFESELDGTASCMKTVSRIKNILTELCQEFEQFSKLFSDNESLLRVKVLPKVYVIWSCVCGFISRHTHTLHKLQNNVTMFILLTNN